MPNIPENKKILKEVLESPGYSTAINLQDWELKYLRDSIESQWIAVMEEAIPTESQKIRDSRMTKYHELSSLVDHNVIWNKFNRCLSQNVVQKIETLPFFAKLKDIFGDFKISDVAYDNEVIKGAKEVYWRLVRPGVQSDVGPLHADKWFHEILDFGGKIFNENTYTLKFWVPIYCEPGKNELMIVPDSHQKIWKHSMKLVDGLPKPVFEDQADPILVETEPGNALIFNEDVLHGGALNMGQETRVSLEITMVFNRRLNG
jgi:hypothetical protein